MLRKWILTILLGAALAPMAATQSAAKFLTNDDVVAMVKAGPDEATILNAIQTQGTDFDVSAKALLALKKSGVSKKVIDAMIGAVKDQQEAAAAVISTAQQKAAAEEAEEKAALARQDAAKAAAPAGATAVAPGMPSVVVVQAGQKQALPLAHTQIAPTKTQASSLDGLSSDGALTQSFASLAQNLAMGGFRPGSSVASMALMANPITGPAMMAKGLFGKRKITSDTITVVWAIPGLKAETMVRENRPAFEVQVDGVVGVNADEYEPALIRLQPSQGNFRLVGATTAKPSEMQDTSDDWEMYASFVEQRVAAPATKVASGRYQLQPSAGLAPGEYAIVLRPVNKEKKFAGSSVGQNVGDGLAFNCVWSFEVQ